MSDNLIYKNTETVVSTFCKHFDRLKHRNFVIYGLGPYTKEILENATEFHFTGLLSEEETDIGKKLLLVDQSPDP